MYISPVTALQGLEGCAALQHLDASGNRLSRLPPRLHLPLLQQLNLAANAFGTWPALPPLPHLCQLDLSDNRLSHVGCVQGMWQLTCLHLGFNNLWDLQNCLAAAAVLPQLQELLLHDNPGLMRHFKQQQEEQRQGQQQQQWQALLAAGDAGDGAAAMAEAGFMRETVMFEAWYRQQVAQKLPWLLVLDHTPLQPPVALTNQ